MEIIGAIGVANVASITQAVVGSAVVGGVLCYELPSKVAGLAAGEVSVKTYVKGTVSLLCRSLPEVLGVCTVLCLAVLLRIRGDEGVLGATPEQLASWERIKVEWPILMGADTLLNLQAMLRLLLLMFVGMRADKSGRSPLSGMASIFFLGSMLARGVLSSHSINYRLEGPLSLNGDLSIACEAAMVPFLAVLAFKALKKFPYAVVAVSLATVFSQKHYFDQAQNQADDSLFTLAHILELFAALAFLLRTISIYMTSSQTTRTSGIVGFMHFLMPAQAALSAYYWLTAFTPDSQLPIGSGKPWCLLIMTNLLQLGCFVCSLSLYLGECFGTDKPREQEAEVLEVENPDQQEEGFFAALSNSGAVTQAPISFQHAF